MMTLDEAMQKIKPLDEAAMQASRRHWDSLAKPLGSLGLLEQAVIQISGITGTYLYSINRRGVVVMCADNGVVAEGVTQCGSEVTAIVTQNMANGQSSVCKMARCAGADIFPVDIGMFTEVSGIRNRKTVCGTQNMAIGPAMTRNQSIAAVEAGIDVVRELKAEGYKILVTGEMGIGNTTSSSAVAAVLTGKNVIDVTGRGAGLSDDGLKKKRAAIARAIEINRPNPKDMLDVLSKVGGLDIAGLCGVFLGGAVYHIPVLIDGFISAVSALIAARLAPLASGYMLASHVSGEPAGRLLLDCLEKKPLITAEMRLGEGSGGVAALPLLDMAYAVYQSMCNFDEAHIDAYQPL